MSRATYASDRLLPPSRGVGWFDPESGWQPPEGPEPEPTDAEQAFMDWLDSYPLDSLDAGDAP